MEQAANGGGNIEAVVVLPQERTALTIINAIAQEPGSIRTQAEKLLSAVAELVIAQPVDGVDRARLLVASASRATIVPDAEWKENERLKTADPTKFRSYLGTMENAADLDRQLQTMVKKLEERRLKVADPLTKASNAWNGLFAPVRLLLDSSFSKAKGTPDGARQILGRKMKNFKLAEMEADRQRLAEEQKALEDKAVATAEVLADAGFTKEAEEVLQEAVEAPPAAPPVVATTVRGDYGGTSSFTPFWALKGITDAAAVPREYCSPDEKKLKEFLKAQPLDGKTPEIPGCQIEKDLAQATR